MPLYTYRCRNCGPFDALVALADGDATQRCEVCGEASQRVITPARLSLLSEGKRRAHQINEKSQHAPSCRCCSGSHKKGGDSTQPRGQKGKRPWMLGH